MTGKYKMFNVTVTAKFLTHAEIKQTTLQLILSSKYVQKFTISWQVLKRCIQMNIGSFPVPYVLVISVTLEIF